ncbi:PREDICTED: coiled-coil domain-containing protein 65-like [Cyphomyrmex costatus]|uniref:Dynein regulatory complex subunit 2 n=1 Tax=Cyphomyrmex costatus TaxID=456900 RepID=A0A195CQ44_9HYME|nr:PREDICTED: coiled-coil domain-containing protein 65-like [Cyphomyrmex costatus]KYN02755.1 Coiled-coil domain-containing protein 65 [Cyphomyrmex costatus]
MPKKKKGKGSKLARMSDEERARYLQHRAELELEAKRRKQQLIAVFTKNKLKREEAFARLNTAKINEQWRFILRRIKCKELHEDMEYLWNNFDRLIKTKNLMIQRLHSELEAADVDHRRLQGAHIKMMDLIIGRYKQKRIRLHESFVRERNHIISDETNELNRIRKNLDQYCSQLQNINFGQDKRIENILTQTKIQNAVYISSIAYLKDDSLSRLMHYVSNEVEKLWRQLNKMIIEYEKDTGDKRKQYEYLKEQDDAHRADVAQYPKLQAQLQRVIKNLKQDMHALSQKREQSIAELNNQIVHIRKRIESSREIFSVNQVLDTTQLKKLTIISTNVRKELQRISEKGLAGLSLLRICSNLEPFSLTVQKYTLRDTGSRRAFTSCMSEPFDKLDKFWEQFNYIKSDNIFMKKECDKLSFENKLLRNMLRTYLLTISKAPVARPLTSVSV